MSEMKPTLNRLATTGCPQLFQTRFILKQGQSVKLQISNWNDLFLNTRNVTHAFG